VREREEQEETRLTDTIDGAGRVETRARASAVIDGFDGMMLIATT
jgi:hypothetical protein